MFCPNCGKADQQPETYCRQCGNFLLDYTKPVKKKTTPEEHLKANSFLSLITALVSFSLAIALFSSIWNRQDIPVIIYVTGGFLFAITAWQIQNFWRTILLKKHFKKQTKPQTIEPDPQMEAPTLEPKPTNQLLPEADLDNFVPQSVVEQTTRKLKTRK